jgi:hypothetical protein
MHTDLRPSDERPATYYLIYGMAQVGSSKVLKKWWQDVDFTFLRMVN